MDPNPFNHASTSIKFFPVSEEKHKDIRELLKNGWGLDAELVEAYGQASGVYSSNLRITLKNQYFNLRCNNINSSAHQKLIDETTSYLRSKGVPTPKIIHTRTGESSFESDNSIFSLTRFIDGEHFDGSRKELANAAELLARLHQILFHFYLKSEIEKTKSAPYAFSKERLDEIRSRASNSNQKFDLKTLKLIQRIEEKSSPHTFNFSNLPQQIGHFDFHPHNLLFDPQSKEIVGLIDFDLIHVSQRARDVALALQKLSRVFGKQTERKNDCGGSLFERASLFLESYCNVNPLENDELKAIPALLIDEARSKILYILEKHYLLSDPSSDFDLEKQATQLEEAQSFNF